jgi:hypothetical protein
LLSKLSLPWRQARQVSVFKMQRDHEIDLSSSNLRRSNTRQFPRAALKGERRIGKVRADLGKLHRHGLPCGVSAFNVVEIRGAKLNCGREPWPSA